MFEVLFLDGSIQKIKQYLLCSYVKLYKNQIFAYRKLQEVTRQSTT